MKAGNTFFGPIGQDFVKMELPLPSHEHVRKQGVACESRDSFGKTVGDA